jgi:hypothetical protein
VNLRLVDRHSHLTFAKNKISQWLCWIKIKFHGWPFSVLQNQKIDGRSGFRNRTVCTAVQVGSILRRAPFADVAASAELFDWHSN